MRVWLCAALLLGLTTAAAASDDWHYTLRPGDTLWKVCQQFAQQPASCWRDLASHNSLADPHSVEPGQNLLVPIAWLKEKPIPARVVAVTGEVMLYPAAGGEARQVQSGEQVAFGDALETAAGGSARLEFADPSELLGDEWAVDCDGFTLYVAATSVAWVDGAEIDFVTNATGSQQLTIKAPKIKGEAPTEGSSLVERVRWVVENEVNPQLASHGGKVAVQEVSADGVVLLRFGGGCQGCGMADVTLKQGIEKTLMGRVPGITAVRDATDHDSGDAPYIPRGTAA